ncbi:MAG: glucose-1-phosphate thymidylyltransferase RfbA [Candidatus Kapabacteria bacterium]|nr:glucose-1-phosphate thymidylyltransferase RfbA [Candidatus Kapabacteria bacterium]
MTTRGIILAGGSGSRLYPLTAAFSKQLQPVYDKPMIFYPLSTLMMAGIRDVLIISTPHDTPTFERLLGDGSRYGISLQYVVQDAPRGLADAFRVGRDFVGRDNVSLILGDNIFYGKLDFYRRAIANNTGATVFGYPVTDPERYGVVEMGPGGKVLSIEEKPTAPKSNLAIPGLYVYNNDVVEIAANLQPGKRGELEITDVHRIYLEREQLNVEMIGRGVAWLDTGTPESLIEASTFIHAIEKRQGLKIGCPEEVALQQGFLTPDEYRASVALLPNCSYRTYCESLLRS